MAKQKDNMFGSFGSAIEEREQEQAKIEAAVTGKAAPEPGTRSGTKLAPGSAGRPRKRADATAMTICISQADKDLVKDYAFAHAVTVSDLIHRWIQETCVE